MSIWLNESDLREDVAGLQQLTLNVAFLADIKQDSVRPQELIEMVQARLADTGAGDNPAGDNPADDIPAADIRLADIRRLLDDLEALRDELETHLALEEFYGYFESAELSYPQINIQADRLKSQHEILFLDLCELCELAASACYGETGTCQSMVAIRTGFHAFVRDFNRHEQEEHELMMRLCNDELGEGD